MRRSHTLLLWFLLLCPGCSFWAVRGPDPLAAGGGDCTSSVAVPVIDGVLAAGLLSLGAAGLVAGSKPQPAGWDFSSGYLGAAAGLLAVGAVEAVATGFGASKVCRCRDARKQFPANPASSVRPP